MVNAGKEQDIVKKCILAMKRINRYLLKMSWASH
jgi:hypothetical protein